ncbi:hypothetical protein FSP39_004371 [Pinctada imbricata]|uniref:Uncharacterized protein n=1 Tax=Pinctada imbricata TaxID=66713 RepID=A0AA88Y4U5_PINIB|nr:hypothetical protein FSP39_004371 [Pinctada imbricata]
MFRWIAAGCTGATLLIMIYRKLFTHTAKCLSTRTLAGKVVIVTGANTGIGKTTSQELAERHAKVIMACRDISKGQSALKDIRKNTKNGILVVKQLDLQSQASVRQFCSQILEEESRLDVLINNAGVMGHPFTLTEDGMEIHMAVNHFSNFLLTNLLLDLLKKSAPSRIVFVSSSLHKRGTVDFSMFDKKQKHPYSNSKLANIYFARALSRNLDGTGVRVHTLHPGMVNTELSRHSLSRFMRVLLSPLAWFLLQSSREGCQTVVYCAVSEELDHVTGRYYGKCKEEPWTEIAKENSMCKKLWEVSERLTGIANNVS